VHYYPLRKNIILLLLYVFFWVILRRLNFICRRFGTLRSFHLHRQVVVVEWPNLRNVEVSIREKVWLESFEPNLLPYGYPNSSQIWSFYNYLPMKMEQTECSETSAYKIQTPGNYPEENILQTEHVESLKSRILFCFMKLNIALDVQNVFWIFCIYLKMAKSDYRVVMNKNY